MKIRTVRVKLPVTSNQIATDVCKYTYVCYSVHGTKKCLLESLKTSFDKLPLFERTNVKMNCVEFTVHCVEIPPTSIVHVRSEI